MKNIISVLFCLILSVADIYLYRKGILFAQPAFSIIPLLLVLVFLYKKNFSFYKQNKNSFLFFLILFLLSVLFSCFSDYNQIITKIGLSLLSILIYIASFNFFLKLNTLEIRKIFIVAILLLGSSMLNDLLFNIDLGLRGAGFAENPNSAAFRINFMIVALLFTISKKIQKIIILVFGFILVFLTLSRGGVILNLIIIILSIANDYNDKFTFKFIRQRIISTTLKLLTIVFIFSSISVSLIKFVPAFQTSTVESRINSLLLNESIINNVDIDTGGRINIFNNYLKLISENPFGYGTGMSSNRNLFPSSTHNMFLRFFIDFGFLGFSFYLFFVIRGLNISLNERNIYYLMFFLLIIFSSFLENNLTENRSFLVSLAVMDVFRVKNKFKII